MKKQKNSIKEEVVKNSGWGFLLGLVTKLGGLFFTIVLARFLLPEGFGTFSLALSIAVLFMTFGGMGINKTLVTFYSKELNKNKKIAESYFRYILSVKLLMIVSTSLILLVSSYFIANYIFKNSQLTSLLVISSFYILFFSLSSFFASFFYIYRVVKIDLFKESIFQISRLALALVIFLILPSSFYLKGTFISLVVASLCMLIFTYFQSKRLNTTLFQKNKIKINKKKIWNFLFYLILGSISLIVFSEIDTLMLGFFIKDLAYLGFYRASFAIILGITGLISFGAILLPVFSSFHKNKIQKAFDSVLKYTTIITIPLLVGIVALGKFFLVLFYGDSYSPASIILYVLVILIFIEVMTNLFSTLLSSREKPKFIAKSIIIVTLLNILLNFILITSLINISLIWATAGAAIATIISRTIYLFSLAFYSKRELGAYLKISHLTKPLLSSAIMGLWLWFLLSNLSLNLFSSGIAILSSAFIYVLSLRFIKGITKEDISIISCLLPKFLNKQN